MNKIADRTRQIEFFNVELLNVFSRFHISPCDPCNVTSTEPGVALSGSKQRNLIRLPGAASDLVVYFVDIAAHNLEVFLVFRDPFS